MVNDEFPKRIEESAIEDEHVAVEEEVVLAPAVEVPDDEPLSVRETVEKIKEVGHTAKAGLLKPGWRLGRRILRNAQASTEAFFEGASGKDKK